MKKGYMQKTGLVDVSESINADKCILNISW